MGDRPPFEPHRTQRIRVQIEKVGSTDRHRVDELLLHAIEQNESQIDCVEQDLRSQGNEFRDRCTRIEQRLVSVDQVRNMINGAFAADAKRRDDAAKERYKGRYFLAVIKYWVPSLFASGGAMGALVHWLTTRGH